MIVCERHISLWVCDPRSGTSNLRIRYYPKSEQQRAIECEGRRKIISTEGSCLQSKTTMLSAFDEAKGPGEPFFESSDGSCDDRDKWVFDINISCDNEIDVIITFGLDSIVNGQHGCSFIELISSNSVTSLWCRFFTSFCVPANLF